MNSIAKTLAAALLLNIPVFSYALADRILVDDDDQTITLTRQLDCDRPAFVTIDTASPAIYDQDAAALQSLSDSVKSILEYECPQIATINVTGLVRGLDEVIYQGVADKQNDWLITRAKVVAGDSSYKAQTQDDHQPEWNQVHKDGRILSRTISVTNLELGMTVDQATRAITETFGEKPEYNLARGLLSLESAGCPDEPDKTDPVAEPQPSVVCLDAWFSDRREAELERVELVQVTDASMDQAEAVYIQKYGNPNLINVSQDGTGKQLVWQAIGEGADNESHQLTASLNSIKDHLVITKTSLTRQPSTENLAEYGTRIDLKL